MDRATRDGIEARFDRESPSWREIYRRSGRNPFAYPDKQYRKRYVLEMLGSGSGRVLDLGCGAGEFFADLRRAGFSVTGADFSSEMVRLAAGAGGAGVARADAVWTPFRAHSFRALIAVGLIEYLPEDGAVLAEFLRILEPGGTAVVTLRNRRCLERRLWNFYARRGWMKRAPAGFFRAHDPAEFEAAAARIGFTDFSRRYCHFYPLPWPLSKILAPLNNLLAHIWEGLFPRSRIAWLGSTIIVRFRAPGKSEPPRPEPT
ncbi:MAG: methyltransferase domain-containing protein [Anaerolineales bacterium]|nr:methyltransferase domain-containing protein [Anaerolineales bacterium]